MSTSDNVSPIPSLLDRLAAKALTLVGRSAANKADFVEINVELCATLAQARSQFKADIPFGQWCDNVGLGKDVINHQTRAAAIVMGREPAALRACLEATERRSLELIYRNEFDRFTSARKPETKRGSGKGSNKVAKRGEAEKYSRARELVRPLIAADKKLELKKLEQEHGISVDTFERAANAELAAKEAVTQYAENEGVALAKAEAAFSDKSKLTLTDAIRIHKARLEKTFHTMVGEEVRKRIAASDDVVRKELSELRKENLRLKMQVERKKVFTVEEYKVIRRCLHPDNSGSTEMRARAFDLVTQKYTPLTGELKKEIGC